MLPELKKTDFPGFYQASDKLSLDAQNYYILILSIDLIGMALGAALAVYNYSAIETKLWTYIISGLLMLASTILTVILKTKKFEDNWYKGRALAESYKTLTWRFITGSELFEHSLPGDQAKKNFLRRVKEINDEFREMHGKMNARLTSLTIITNMMETIRSLPLNERLDYYVKYRIENQKNWYSDKAEFNEKKYNMWFAIIISVQALTVISIVYLIAKPTSNWNLVGFFTTVSASALSWLQVKQHQELKQAYTTTTQELNMILAMANAINTEDELSKFVLDSENAVSREHTLWLAQKRR